MKIATYFLILIAALTTAFIGVRVMSRPITPAALGFIVWAVSPYVYLAVMAALASTKASIAAVSALSFLAGAFGVWLLVDAMFIHLDAQGGLIFIFAPLWQWGFLILTTLPLYFFTQAKNT